MRFLQHKSSIAKRGLSVLCILALCLGLMPTAAFAGTDTGKAIQLVDSGTAANIGGGQADNIYFGTYQQSNAGSTVPDGMEGVDWIKSDTAIHNEQGPYYYIEPVKWRVLSNENGQLFLLSNQNLDVFKYHTDYESVTWEKSTMRSWLNGYGASANTGGDSGTDYTNDNFINTAFSSGEQGAIAQTYVYNATQSDGSSNPNPSSGTPGGENTTDKIFLLSIEEANNSSYFPNGNDSRISTNTAYVAGGGKIGSHMNDVGAADSCWLRSPGGYVFHAASVVDLGGVYSLGAYVSYEGHTVRPAFHLDLKYVLFTSAAVGGKSPAAGSGGNQGAVGADAIFEIGAYTGNEWKLTLLDSSRNFSISDAAINSSGDTMAFSYSNAQTGTNEYISVVIEDNGAITHYGRILQLDGTTGSASGTASLTLPAGVTLDNDTKLYVFNEQYNGGENDDTKRTDYGSKLIEVDITAPTLTAGTATRISETTATVKFTSDEAGTCYYIAQDTEITLTKEQIAAQGTKQACKAGENEIELDSITANTQYVAVVVQDAAGNISDVLKFEIPAYIAPVYAISADTQLLDFGTVTEGYTQAPAAKKVTITNTGNQTVTVDLPTSTNYIITAGEGFTNDTATLAPNGTASFTAQPKTGLGAGDYSETLTISGSDGADEKISLSFEVLATYTLTVNLNGGSGSTTGGEYTEGTAVPIDAGSKAGYRFAGWTSSNDGTFADASSAQTTFTMPAADTTITANWTAVPSGPTTYQVVIDSDVTGGTVTASPRWAARGDTVSLTATADEGYELSALSVSDRNGDAITLDNEGGGVYSFTMPIGRVTVTATFDKAVITLPFTDVHPGDWFYEPVCFVYSQGLMTGTSATTFEPNTSLSRAMLVAVLHRLEGSPAASGGDFSDVASGDWYAEAVNWAASVGVVNGFEDGSFQPNAAITREQMAAILRNYAQYKGMDVTATGDLSAYTDAASVSDWAKESVEWAVEQGLLSGMTVDTLQPQGLSTRAQVAAVLQRYLAN